MKKSFAIIFSLLLSISGYCQHENIDKEIRQAEEQRAAAFRTKDTATLLKIWATDYTVNRPAGVVSTRDQVLDLVLKDTISFTSFEYEIEKILIKKDFTVVMDNETVIPKGNNPDAGKTLKRRYTHIWIKDNSKWRLFVRHANVLSKQ